jgi:hypothetical protein
MGVGPTGTEAEPPVQIEDSLRSDPGDRFDLVFTFGQTTWRVEGRGWWAERGPWTVNRENGATTCAQIEEFELILGDLST